MRIEITYAKPQAYYRRHLAAGAMRALWLRLTVVAGLAVLGSLVVAYGDDVEGFTAVWIGGIFVVFIAGVLWGARRRYVELVTAPDFWCEPRTYVVDDEGLHRGHDLSAVTYRWPLVLRVTVIPEAFVFHLEHYGIFDLPRAPLTGEQEAELQQFLADRDNSAAAA
ncbi:YcxB family protein [Dactylosporangium sp. NPDC005572]|uniref:YcxB family protein n=1 Tax=Dactylosporangium sp. NPDC005572 TaxID=3156889 RepID=UPI0033AAD751